MHGIDLCQYIARSRVRTVTGARCWSTGRAPNIQDAAQVCALINMPAGRLMADLPVDTLPTQRTLPRAQRVSPRRVASALTWGPAHCITLPEDRGT